MLRKQAKQFCQLLYGISQTESDFAIAELILNGFLIQKNISKSYKTQMLYLSKYPRSRFYENIEKSGDVPALNFTKQKLFEQIFRMDYILDVIIPVMQKQNFKLDAENILAYLTYTRNNLLYANNQTSILQLYHLIGYTLQEKGFTLSDDFYRDMEIASYDKTIFEVHLSRDNPFYPHFVQKGQSVLSSHLFPINARIFYSLFWGFVFSLSLKCLGFISLSPFPKKKIDPKNGIFLPIFKVCFLLLFSFWG